MPSTQSGHLPIRAAEVARWLRDSPWSFALPVGAWSAVELHGECDLSSAEWGVLEELRVYQLGARHAALDGAVMASLGLRRFRRRLVRLSAATQSQVRALRPAGRPREALAMLTAQLRRVGLSLREITELFEAADLERVGASPAAARDRAWHRQIRARAGHDS